MLDWFLLPAAMSGSGVNRRVIRPFGQWQRTNARPSYLTVLVVAAPATAPPAPPPSAWNTPPPPPRNKDKNESMIDQSQMVHQIYWRVTVGFAPRLQMKLSEAKSQFAHPASLKSKQIDVNPTGNGGAASVTRCLSVHIIWNKDSNSNK